MLFLATARRVRGSLPGPSRRITVEPLETPVPAVPPDREPAPVPAPERRPAEPAPPVPGR